MNQDIINIRGGHCSHHPGILRLLEVTSSPKYTIPAFGSAALEKSYGVIYLGYYMHKQHGIPQGIITKDCSSKIAFHIKNDLVNLKRILRACFSLTGVSCWLIAFWTAVVWNTEWQNSTSRIFFFSKKKLVERWQLTWSQAVKGNVSADTRRQAGSLDPDRSDQACQTCRINSQIGSFDMILVIASKWESPRSYHMTHSDNGSCMLSRVIRLIHSIRKAYPGPSITHECLRSMRTHAIH